MAEPVCWIDDVDYRDADPKLRVIYDQVLSSNGQLDNLYRGFSLSPQTILPADALYKAALHHSNNVLPGTFAELIGTYVAILSGCNYARAHHGQNYIALSGDSAAAQKIAQKIIDALEDDWARSHSNAALTADSTISAAVSVREIKALEYVRKLCIQPEKITQDDIMTLRSADWSDEEISEIVQVVSMFSYFVRVINGLGIALGDEKLGLY